MTEAGARVWERACWETSTVPICHIAIFFLTPTPGTGMVWSSSCDVRWPVTCPYVWRHASQDVSSDTKLRPRKFISLPRFIPSLSAKSKEGLTHVLALYVFIFPSRQGPFRTWRCHLLLWRRLARVLSYFSRVQLFVTPRITIACQTPLSMRFSRQEYWSGLPCPRPDNLPDTGTEPVSCIGREVLYHWATWEAFTSH